MLTTYRLRSMGTYSPDFAGFMLSFSLVYRDRDFSWLTLNEQGLAHPERTGAAIETDKVIDIVVSLLRLKCDYSL